jgi:hypothetical protein
MAEFSVGGCLNNSCHFPDRGSTREAPFLSRKKNPGKGEKPGIQCTRCSTGLGGIPAQGGKRVSTIVLVKSDREGLEKFTTNKKFFRQSLRRWRARFASWYEAGLSPLHYLMITLFFEYKIEYVN